VIVHTHALRFPVKIMGQLDGPVAIMQAGHAQVFSGFVVGNMKRKVSVIVHQYDRYADLQERIFLQVIRDKMRLLPPLVTVRCCTTTMLLLTLLCLESLLHTL
jgi:hypothetical protein